MIRDTRSIRASTLVALVVSIASTTLGVAAHAGAWDPVEKIAGTRPVIVQVNRKSRIYFPLSAKRPLSIDVEGPARLRVVSRAQVSAGAATPVTYSIRASTGGKMLGETRTESSPAPDARRKDGKGVLCKSRALLVEVPAGHHPITISAGGASPLLVRILVASPRRAPQARMVSLTPVEARTSLTVVEAERMIPYYATRRGAPVRFRVVGPTTLEITSRLDFDATMRGAQRYRLAYRVGTAIVREESFTTTKAAAATYSEAKDRVPSKLDRVVLAIGEGVHDVSVELTAPKSGTAQIHARIPQPSVGNEE